MDRSAGGADRVLPKALVKAALDQILQAEMTKFLGAAPGERSGSRLRYRAGYYERGLVARVPRDRSGGNAPGWGAAVALSAA